jgi:hypothetical protein
MDPVAIQRRLLGHAITLPHLAQQPLTPWAVDTGQAHDTGRDAAGQRQLLGLQHHLAGIALGLGAGSLVDPLAVLLRINAAAGHEQQPPGQLPPRCSQASTCRKPST